MTEQMNNSEYFLNSLHVMINNNQKMNYIKKLVWLRVVYITW
jgi:hypothetical protein